ncbi:glycosyltransferase family 2 protein [Jannaschia aquimarina]|uniref:HyaD protein n=1 Tax=Jannaschia aquimarina TaxID=935700 RepID=A0A0D1EHK9_9RHOB|nr:glycosyltransferase [Jannaschia aquimarina]KIT17169.1 Hyaluronan synthase [Jannaschia aquimarina]SNT17715.1 Glycosyl transferase family 2 [Jannaschia aquimarina]
MKAATVVASYDRPAHIKACVECLLGIDGDFEIVVVDDGSPTPYAPLLADYGPRVRCIRQNNAGPAAARNRGVRDAGADFVAFTDDDCRPHKDWFTALQAAHSGVADRLVGGRIVNSLKANVFSEASQDLSTYLYEYFGADRDLSFFTTNNLAFSRARFEDLGGLDASFRFASEDRDLSMRWRAAGGHLTYAEGAVVDHLHRLGLTSFLRQHLSYGRGARTLHLKMDATGDDRPKVEPFRFYRDLMLYPLRKRGIRGVPGSILMGLSQVAMVAGYGAEIRDRRRAARISGQGRSG